MHRSSQSIAAIASALAKAQAVLVNPEKTMTATIITIIAMTIMTPLTIIMATVSSTITTRTCKACRSGVTRR